MVVTVTLYSKRPAVAVPVAVCGAKYAAGALIMSDRAVRGMNATINVDPSATNETADVLNFPMALLRGACQKQQARIDVAIRSASYFRAVLERAAP
jgi:hypothetical protein